MVAFARIKARSLISMLWPVKRVQDKLVIGKIVDVRDEADFSSNSIDEKEYFLEVVKKGGCWFSWLFWLKIKG